MEKWLFNGSRRWTVIVDTATLPTDSRRPVSQQLQERVLAALGMSWLDEIRSNSSRSVSWNRIQPTATRGVGPSMDPNVARAVESLNRMAP